MKKLTIALVEVAAIFTSCENDVTQYNGFVKNSTSEKITINVASEYAFQDTFSIAAGETRQITGYNVDGDFEIFDCANLIDSVWYSNGQGNITIDKETAVFASTSILSSDGTRVHDCTLDIKQEVF